jgi:hypothetical protein
LAGSNNPDDDVTDQARHVLTVLESYDC